MRSAPPPNRYARAVPGPSVDLAVFPPSRGPPSAKDVTSSSQPLQQQQQLEKWQRACDDGPLMGRCIMTPCGSQWGCLPCNRLLHPCRKAVSKKKRRYQKNGFDLDLVYLDPRIIIMGFPAAGIEHLFRNPRSEIKRFLDTNHPDSYKVFNFCCEPGRGYPASLFDGRVERFPFLDHGCPYLETITNFCESAAAWLDADPKHVVALHCKAGKGRAGLMACCLLIRMNLQGSASEAIDYYNRTRVSNGKGLTVPTQITNVGYYDQCLRLQKRGLPLPRPLELRLVEVALVDMESGELLLESKPGFFTLYTGAGATKQKECVSAVGNSQFPCNVLIRDVVGIEFKLLKKPKLRCIGAGGKKKKGKKLFMYNFNTAFVEQRLVREADGALTLAIPKRELDKLVKDKDHSKVPASFHLRLRFQRVGGTAPNNPAPGSRSQKELTFQLQHLQHQQAPAPPPPAPHQHQQQHAQQQQQPPAPPQQQVAKYTAVPPALAKGEVEV